MGEPEPSSPSTVRFALLLAAFLALVVLGLDALSPQAVRVPPERLAELLEQGIVERISVDDRSLQGDLTRRIDVEQGGRRLPARRVSVSLEEFTEPPDFDAFRQRGVNVERRPRADESMESTWLAVALGLLGIGSWYLIAQAKHSQAHRSPRQELKDLEEEFRAGTIGRQEYEKRVASISPEI